MSAEPIYCKYGVEDNEIGIIDPPREIIRIQHYSYSTENPASIEQA